MEGRILAPNMVAQDPSTMLDGWGGGREGVGVMAGKGWGWRQGGGGGGGREGVGVIKNFQPFSTMVDHFMGLFIPGHLYSCYEQASQW